MRNVNWAFVVEYCVYPVGVRGPETINIPCCRHPEFGWVAMADESPLYWTVN